VLRVSDGPRAWELCLLGCVDGEGDCPEAVVVSALACARGLGRLGHWLLSGGEVELNMYYSNTLARRIVARSMLIY